MNITLDRDVRTPEFTLGRLSIDGQPECFTAEDCVRDGEKVHGKTAIPPGRYRILITHSPRFKKPLPLLLDVPGFDGVRIHPGNDAGDTEGCILPGRARTADGVAESRVAHAALQERIAAALLLREEVWIEILP